MLLQGGAQRSGTIKSSSQTVQLLTSGTLSAANLELKKYVLRSQSLEAADKKTRIGEDGELTLVTKEVALVSTVSVSHVLIAAET